MLIYFTTKQTSRWPAFFISQEGASYDMKTLQGSHCGGKEECCKCNPPQAGRHGDIWEPESDQ